MTGQNKNKVLERNSIGQGFLFSTQTFVVFKGRKKPPWSKYKSINKKDVNVKSKITNIFVLSNVFTLFTLAFKNSININI